MKKEKESSTAVTLHNTQGDCGFTYTAATH